MPRLSGEICLEDRKAGGWLRPRFLLLAAVAPAALAAPAAAQAQAPSQPQAQPAPAAPAKSQEGKPGQSLEGVVVTGERSTLRTDIDRRSYSVAGDLQATTGSISDALRNIPSLQVDVQGNVSLRGDSNVTIMIDGKPSGMFQGEGRAAALQALPADQIERVEVLTNPSAAMNPEGSAGIINLVTKQNRKLGASGSVRANVGSDGRWNAGVSGARNNGRFTVSGDLSYRHDTQKAEIDDRRARLDGATGAFIENRQQLTSLNEIDMVFARGGLDYDPDDKTRITLQATAHVMRPTSDGFEHLETDDAAGALARVIDRVSDFEQARDRLDLSTSYRRKFAGEEHELVANLGQEFGRVERDFERATFLSLPPAPDLAEVSAYDNRTRKTELKVDYTRPMPLEAKLKAGYLLQLDDNRYEQVGRRGPAGAAPPVDPRLTYDFDYDQAINAAYATYQQPLGDGFSVLAGLRLEDVRLDLDLTTGGPVSAKNDYFRAYPSLHLQHEFGEGRQLTASYSRRVQRPTADDLNPFRVELDPFNLRAGNPNLKPQETDAFELAYQHRKGATYYLATLYYRQSDKGITDVVQDLGNGVFLTTRENLRESRSGGLELVANGRLTPKLTYNLSGNVFWNEIDASSLGFSDKRDAFTVSGRGNLNWQVTDKDFLQLNGFVSGKRLTAQGHVQGFSMLNIGYRHKFTDKLSLVITAQDVLGTFRETQVLDTPTLQGRTRREFSLRGVYVGFTRTFGGGRQRDPGFEFGGGPPAQ